MIQRKLALAVTALAVAVLPTYVGCQPGRPPKPVPATEANNFEISAGGGGNSTSSNKDKTGGAGQIVD